MVPIIFLAGQPRRTDVAKRGALAAPPHLRREEGITYLTHRMVSTCSTTRLVHVYQSSELLHLDLQWKREAAATRQKGVLTMEGPTL